MLVRKDEQKGFTVAARTVYSLGNALCHGTLSRSLLKGSLFVCNQKRVLGERTSSGLETQVRCILACARFICEDLTPENMHWPCGFCFE